jgi:hypothetical protein
MAMPPNAANDVPDNDPDAPSPNGTDTTKGPSAYKKRLEERGLDSFTIEAPKELIDMLRIVAKEADDISLAAMGRFLIADAVNAANLTHEVTHPDGSTTIETWTFDKSRLTESGARAQSTRGLTEEQKKAKLEEKKQSDKAEREYVKALLAAHKAKLKGGDPAAKALEEQLAAKG